MKKYFLFLAQILIVVSNEYKIIDLSKYILDYSGVSISINYATDI